MGRTLLAAPSRVSVEAEKTVSEPGLPTHWNFEIKYLATPSTSLTSSNLQDEVHVRLPLDQPCRIAAPRNPRALEFRCLVAIPANTGTAHSEALNMQELD